MKHIRIFLAIGFLLLALVPHGVRAMQSTPTPWSSTVRDGFVAGASRDFQASGIRLLGSNYLSVSVFVFDSDDVAKQAIAEISRNVLPILPVSQELQPASVRDIGDEAQAFLTKIESGDTEFPTGIVLWRDGSVVYLGLSASLAGDPLAELFDLSRTITGREFVDSPVEWSGDKTDMRSGGAWDLLPTLIDLPEGFVFTKEDEIGKIGEATPTP